MWPTSRGTAHVCWTVYSKGEDCRQEALVEVGKRADLIALSDDVFSCTEETITGITPTMVMVGGRIVGEA
jgi:predicted amidohydrolase YtcJ